MPGKRKATIDWESIEAEYRAGQLSIRAIGSAHGVSEGAIRKTAKVGKWQRSLVDKVRQAVRDTLVRSDGTQAGTHSVRADDEVVDTAAARGVELVRQHRRSLGRAQTIIEKLLFELERGTDNIDEIEEAVEEETVGDTNGKRRAMMLKAVSLPQRAQTAAALSLTIKNIIPLERQAFSLDEPGETEGKRGVVDLSDEALAAIAGGSGTGASS